MRLLICTQAVDAGSPTLGFFVRWLEEFAKYAERVDVICLTKGKYSLPANVYVHSLGKESGASRLKYIVTFYRYAWFLRKEYDIVFAHMNPEYVVLGGLLWRVFGKRIALWYTHKSVDLKLRLAELLSHVIFTASRKSFRLASSKVRIVGHGIDVDFFSPGNGVRRESAVLSVGRLDISKRHDLVIRAAEHFSNEIWIVGSGPERKRLEQLADDLSVERRVRFLGPQSQEQLRETYRHAGVFVHMSETGSLDKIVLEALACGLPVVTTSTALAELPVLSVAPDPESIAGGIFEESHVDPAVLVAYVREHHSLERLIPAIVDVMLHL